MEGQNKKGLQLLLAVLLALVFCGCGKKAVTPDGRDGDASPAASEVHFLDEESLVWEDNTLDDLHAVLSLPIKPVMAEGEQKINTTLYCLFGDNGCGVLRRHHLASGEEDWCSVNGFTIDGEEYFTKLDLGDGMNVVDEIGPVSGKDTYVAGRDNLEKVGSARAFQFYELDQTFSPIRSISVTLKTSDTGLASVMGDANGNFHVIYYDVNLMQKYAVISPEGKVVLEGCGENMLFLCAFGNGRVALRQVKESDAPLKEKFFEANLETGELREVTVSKDPSRRKKRWDYVHRSALIDEYRMAVCTVYGLVLFDSRDGEQRLAYKWSNHGLSVPRIEDVMVMGDGRIGVLIAENSNRTYFLLQTTEEKTEIQTVTLAASPEHKAAYVRAAAIFNKRFPTYNIDVRDDLDETSLLTQLGAGDGPVLVDTALTGFEDLERLWQPLDAFLEKSNLAKELIPETQGFGRIGDKQCGIVTSFTITTLIAPDDGPADWDYEGFLNALEEKKGAAPFSYWFFDVEGDRREEFFEVLKNGLSDTYYLDAEAGTTIFGTERFDRVVRLAQQARKCKPAEGGAALREGKAISEVYYVLTLRQVIDLRMRLESGGGHAIGFPTKAGARHLLVAGEPIAIRVTATEEEKKIAYTFLKILLSEESESAVSGFPVRRDALEAQLAIYEESQSSVGETYALPALDREKDVALLEEMIRNGTPQRSFPSALERVFDEEIAEYLDGRIDARALSEHLKNRVQLYLNEQ